MLPVRFISEIIQQSELLTHLSVNTFPMNNIIAMEFANGIGLAILAQIHRMNAQNLFILSTSKD